MSHSKNSTTSSDTENPEPEIRISPNPPITPSNKSFMARGVRIVHEAPLEDCLSSNAANATVPGNDYYLPYMVNGRAVKIRNTRTVRGLGVFASHYFPRDHTIIKEQPTFTCAIPIRKDAASWRKTFAERWCSLSGMHQKSFKSQFVKMQHMPTRAKQLTARQSKSFLSFIKEYAFCNPTRTMIHIYRWACHINHACRSCANAEIWIEPGVPHSITVRLVRDVKEGEELFICYNRTSGESHGCAICGPGGSRRARFNMLWRWTVRWVAGRSSFGHQDEQEPSPQASPTMRANVTTVVDAATDVETTANVNARAPADAEVLTKTESPTHDNPSETHVPLWQRVLVRLGCS